MTAQGRLPQDGGTASLGLSPEAFTLLRDLIHERTGLFFADDRADTLGGKLSTLVVDRGFGSFLDYYYALKYDAGPAREWPHVFNALSVQETFFWRESDQFRALIDVVLPEHFGRDPSAPFTIWSAACATGPEPLSIAMALEEKGWWARAPIRLLASDASTQAVEAARRGLYRERALRNLPRSFVNAYFEHRDDLWAVSPAISRRVEWRVINVSDEAQAAQASAASAVFCRNLFIYFSREAIERVVGMLAARMPSPGYLFLGSSESLLTLNTPFKLREAGGAFFYVK